AQGAPRSQYGGEHGCAPPSQVRAMDDGGRGGGVWCRTCPPILDRALDPEYARDLARAWNDWITDFCRHEPTRLKAAGVIPLHDADIAAEEARRCIEELGHVGVCLTPEHHNGRALHDPYYDPL